MTGKTIQNPVVQSAGSTQYGERDMLQDALASEKYLVHSYGIAAQEASHEALFQLLSDQSSEISKLQRNMYQQMFEKGWYQLVEAEPQEISQTSSQFKQQ
ncbi:spore coat protein [Paenisporosarcina cavernae]|uniref:Spore coat protein n=1 Tax=Paenisporosarcina cavernae TaxID=2320858 RepID=A0A385YWK8_9BACL|nr:spore coat protein [Paenisporosarcina cavernae]AYC30058.1 spore coat protein [Paenisporosarcina cavernae]